MLSLDRQWRQEWVFERSCGRILWLTRNPIGAAWSHPLLSSVGSIKEAIQERLAQTLTHFDRCSHTHTQAREGQSFEWVTEWETWQKWVCWKTVLPLFAGPLQKRQWSGENLWTSCSCTNVRHILFMPFPFLMYIMNLFFWMYLMNSIGLTWIHRDDDCIVAVCQACMLSLNFLLLSHWMNGLLNMVNGSHSNPRLTESYIHMESEKDHRSNPTIHIMVFIQIHSFCDVKSACDAIRSWHLRQEMSFSGAIVSLIWKP